VTRNTGRIIEASLVVLFTLQAIRVLFSMLFAQIYEVAFEGQPSPVLSVAGGLLVLALLVPLISPRRAVNLPASLTLSAIACAVARLPLSVDIPALRLIASIIVLGCSSVYVAGLLRLRASLLVYALSLGAFADQVLRAMGLTYDPSLRLGWLPVQALLVAGLIYMARQTREEEDEPPQPAGAWAGIAYGAALFMLSSLVALPNAAARWTDGSYPLMVLWLLAAALLPLVRPVRERVIEGILGCVWAARVLVIPLILLGLLVADKTQGGLTTAVLLATVALFWLLLPLSLRSGTRGVRAGMVVGMTLFLLLSISHALAFTYAYTLDLFQGAGLPTFLVAALLALGPALLYQPRPWPAAAWQRAQAPRTWWATAGLSLLVVLPVSLPARPPLVSSVDTARLGTYNIHYGFNTYWNLSLEEQARAIVESGADVIALQEVDTGRLTSFGVDNALWLARRLGMQVVYLPTVEHTTGIAVLSRLDIQASESQLLPAEGEPTGIIRVVVDVGGQPVKVHGIWLGLTPEERDRQIAAALDFIGEGRATLAGDLNATPDSPVCAAMRGQEFLDPFVTAGLDGACTSPAVNPRHRIDYVWVRGLEPAGAQVLDSLASDHRMVVVEAR